MRPSAARLAATARTLLALALLATATSTACKRSDSVLEIDLAGCPGAAGVDRITVTLADDSGDGGSQVYDRGGSGTTLAARVPAGVQRVTVTVDADGFSVTTPEPIELEGGLIQVAICRGYDGGTDAGDGPGADRRDGVELPDATGDTDSDAAGDADGGADLPDGPTITRIVTVAGPGSVGGTSEVRQGAGPVRLQVTGTMLQGVSAAQVNGVGADIVAGPTDTSLELRATFGPGAAIGPASVRLSIGAGGITSNLLAITPITADSIDGSDDPTRADGTGSNPYLTMKVALSRASTGDTVLLRDGTYEVGEAFPTYSSGDLPPENRNLPAGITVMGQSQAGTILRGPSTSPGTAAFIPSGTGDRLVQNLTITRFGLGIYSDVGTTTLDSVTLQGNGYGVAIQAFPGTNLAATVKVTGTSQILASEHYGAIAWSHFIMNGGRVSANAEGGVFAISNGIVDLTDVEIDTNGGSGLYAGANGDYNQQVNLVGGRVHDNGVSGLYLDSSNGSHSTVNITGTEIFANGVVGQPVEQASGILITAVNLGCQSGCPRTTVSMNGGSIHSHLHDGIHMQSFPQHPSSVDLTGVDIHDNGFSGVTLVGSGQHELTLRDTDLQSNDYGLRVLAPFTRLDLGASVADPGNNRLSNNTSCQLSDERDTTGAVISAVATTLSCSGCSQQPSGQVQGPTNQCPLLNIAVINQIQF